MENTYYIALRERTLPDDPLGNNHFVFHKVEGKPVVIEGYEALDLFVHAHYNYSDSYIVSCGKTGQSVGWSSDTEEEAINNASNALERKGLPQVLDLLNKYFPKYHSPRWKTLEEKADA